MTVRVRFAPSPTGYLHIGGARSALFTWMFARRHGGSFILRIEDTDLKRTKEGAIDDIMASLRWLQIDWDEGPYIGGAFGPYIQTERAELYQYWANWLLDQGHAYRCFCTTEEVAQRREERQAQGKSASGYDRFCRSLSQTEVDHRIDTVQDFTVRFKMSLEGETIVPDLIRGDIRFDNKEVTDFVLLKSNGLPTYHLAHIVDDHLMEISHVTRGVEWISTAPLHVNIYTAFGWNLPVFVHLPVILNPSGKGKLSKRTQAFDESGQEILVRVEEFFDAGYLPEALVNFIANVGWSFGDDREKFSMSEAIPRFDLADINPAETRLPYEKLDWLNGQYIQEMTPSEIASNLKPYLEKAGYTVDLASLTYVTGSLAVRLKRLTDAIPLLRFLYVDEPVELTAEQLVDKKLPRPSAQLAFSEAREFISGIEPFNSEAIGSGLIRIGESYTSNGKAGPFLGRLRLAITGQKVSPPLFESMMAMGRERVLSRFDQAMSVLRD
jgi:glutamyl-tRNA synthetase